MAIRLRDRHSGQHTQFAGQMSKASPGIVMRSVDTLKQHLAHPEKSFDAYLGEQRLTLGELVRNRGRIYLDSKYWILLRNAAMGRESSHSIHELLAALREGVSSSRLLCPIGADTFTEILSQTDEFTLMESVRLIDELSQGVAIIFHDERVLLELLAFAYAGMPGKGSYDPKVRAWTKVAFVLGFRMPGNTPFSRDQEEAMQKTFLDLTWDASLADMVQTIGVERIRALERESDMSSRLNENKLRYRPGCKSYKEAFLSEIAGILDFLRPDLSDTLCYLAERYPELKGSKEVANAPESVQWFANLIYHAFRLDRLSTQLPFVKIQASLHAAISWDTSRKYKRTDPHDILHATAALPYFHVFLTERSLKHLITRKDLSLDKLYGCRVISDPTEAAKKIDRFLNHH
jgi:hypothetical protein